MRERAQILILKTTPFGDSSLVLHCISDLWGRRSFMASRGSKSSPLLQSGNILDCEVTTNPKSDLWRAGEFSLKYPLASIRNSIPKTAISLFMSEVLYRTVREGMAEQGELFRWVEQSFLTLDVLGDDYANFHIVFLLGLASALGFRPTAESMAPFAGDDYDLIEAFLGSATSEAMMIQLNGHRRAGLCRTIVKYLEFHTEASIELKSIDVLHELFDA